MDIQFLHKLGLVVSNIRNLLLDRGYDVTELNSVVSSDTLETAGLLYQRSKTLDCSLAEAARFQVKKLATQQRARIWLLDRNYDVSKLKERMTSTDQIKSIYDAIASDPDTVHIVVTPTKCSPQAKKELPVNAEIFIFDELLIDLPRHVQVSRHSQVTEQDLQRYLGKSFQKGDLPLLPTSDPMARWYAWPKGSIIFIDNPVMPKFRIVS